MKLILLAVLILIASCSVVENHVQGITEKEKAYCGARSDIFLGASIIRNGTSGGKMFSEKVGKGILDNEIIGSKMSSMEKRHMLEVAEDAIHRVYEKPRALPRSWYDNEYKSCIDNFDNSIEDIYINYREYIPTAISTLVKYI